MSHWEVLWNSTSRGSFSQRLNKQRRRKSRVSCMNKTRLCRTESLQGWAAWWSEWTHQRKESYQIYWTCLMTRWTRFKSYANGPKMRNFVTMWTPYNNGTKSSARHGKPRLKASTWLQSTGFAKPPPTSVSSTSSATQSSTLTRALSCS